MHNVSAEELAKWNPRVEHHFSDWDSPTHLCHWETGYLEKPSNRILVSRVVRTHHCRSAQPNETWHSLDWLTSSNLIIYNLRGKSVPEWNLIVKGLIMLKGIFLVTHWTEVVWSSSSGLSSTRECSMSQKYKSRLFMSLQKKRMLWCCAADMPYTTVSRIC